MAEIPQKGLISPVSAVEFFRPPTPARRASDEWRSEFQSFVEAFIAGPFTHAQQEARRVLTGCTPHLVNGLEVICRQTLRKARSFDRAMTLYRRESTGSTRRCVSFRSVLERDGAQLCKALRLFARRKHAEFELPKLCQPLVKTGVLRANAVKTMADSFRLCTCDAESKATLEHVRQLLQPWLARVGTDLAACTDTQWVRCWERMQRAAAVVSRQVQSAEREHTPLLRQELQRRDALKEQLESWRKRRAAAVEQSARRAKAERLQQERDREYAAEQSRRREAERVRTAQREAIEAEVRQQASFLSPPPMDGLITAEVEVVFAAWLDANPDWNLPDPDELDRRRGE